MHVTELTDTTLNAALQSGVTLIDFWAPWCGPCRMQTPILEDVAKEMGDRATIAKVNVDECPASAATYGVRSIPTLILFKEGQIVEQMVGVQQKAQLVQTIQSNL